MILAYHHVIPPALLPDPPPPSEGWEYRTSPEALGRHVEEFRARGRRVISLAEYVTELRSSGREPPGTVVLTFDDGWLDNYQHALPVLSQLDVCATFFLTTEHLREGGSPDATRMSQHQVLELLDAGMAIGAHTRTHPHLTRLGPEEQVAEIEGSRRDIEAVFGQSPAYFAYPYGDFRRGVVDRVRAAGYEAAVSSLSLSPARNTCASRYWLHRDQLSDSMRTLRDRARLFAPARRLFELRTRRRLVRMLAD